MVQNKVVTVAARVAAVALFAGGPLNNSDLDIALVLPRIAM
jgi:hypothetical protein